MTADHTVLSASGDRLTLSSRAAREGGRRMSRCFCETTASRSIENTIAPKLDWAT